MPRKERVGTVLSNKMEKTIVVGVSDRQAHPVYGKIVNRTIKFKAHDENNECSIGDVVRIRESRPLSREKRWALVAIEQKVESVAEKV